MEKHITYLDTERSILMFFCPGCWCGHGVWFDPKQPNEVTGAHWSWNGDRDKPTISPSILVNGTQNCPSQPRCHSYVRDGQIQFLPDCTHELAGQTVTLEPF